MQHIDIDAALVGYSIGIRGDVSTALQFLESLGCAVGVSFPGVHSEVMGLLDILDIEDHAADIKSRVNSHRLACSRLAVILDMAIAKLQKDTPGFCRMIMTGPATILNSLVTKLVKTANVFNDPSTN